jgi:hypothetical protein
VRVAVAARDEQLTKNPLGLMPRGVQGLVAE